MRRMALIACATVLMLMLSGCSSYADFGEEVDGVQMRFVRMDTGEPFPQRSSHNMDEQYIVLDTQTGVEYLWVRNGRAAGLTPLLDSDGKPLLSEDYD